MATLVRGYTFGATEQVTASKLHNLIDNGSITLIVNDDISSSAAIADTKLANITTAGKVSGLSLTALGDIDASAGSIPAANVVAITAGDVAGGTGSAGAGKQYVVIKIGTTKYKLLHDGTVA